MSEKVLIIAEAGSNWKMGTPHRDLEMARRLIEVAAEAGADVVKFQTFRPDTLYVENAGKSDYLAKAGIHIEMHDLFADLMMPYEMLAELCKHCENCGIEFMSTPFSEEDFHAVDPLVARHKLASYEISHLRLIELMAQSGKPLILSTGASPIEDVDWAVDTFLNAGGTELTLMQCTLTYPTPPEDVNLRVIRSLKNRFSAAVGLSDHTREPILAPLGAVALGATVIEKHFTLHNSLPGPDHAFAITPNELKDLVKAIRTLETMLGSDEKAIAPSEEEMYQFGRRGLQVTSPIAEGETFREGKNLAILRPGKQTSGVHPKFLSEIEGKAAKRSLLPGEGIQHGDW